MSKHRNNQQWLELITECRQSGMSDMDWCRANGISHSTFYKAIHRLQEAACKLPESLACSSTMLNLTSAKQDIVPISIIPDTSAEVNNVLPEPTPYIMEITKCDMTIRVTKRLMTAFGGFISVPSNEMSSSDITSLYEAKKWFIFAIEDPPT